MYHIDDLVPYRTVAVNVPPTDFTVVWTALYHPLNVRSMRWLPEAEVPMRVERLE